MKDLDNDEFYKQDRESYDLLGMRFDPPSEGEPKGILICNCRPIRNQPLALKIDERSLVRVAQEILRHFRPTSEDKILDVLLRLEYLMNQKK